jgi:hypothetical protein
MIPLEIAMRSNLLKPLIFALLILLIFPVTYSREVPKVSPYLVLQSFKDNNDVRQLRATLTYSKNRMEIPISGMTITFFVDGKQKTKISVAVTDEKGVAEIILKDTGSLTPDEEGKWSFISEYDGNDTIESSVSKLSVRDISLKMELNEVDTIKTISVKASKIEKGIEIPVPGELVTIYVPRMFSLLPIGEITLDDAGTGSVEFPADLPGDKEGNITIIAKIEDHPDYGFLEKRETVKWGTVSDYSSPAGHRALWTKTAPRWMIYTLSVLLTGVWGHYLFAIISLIRIKRNALKEKKSEPEEV